MANNSNSIPVAFTRIVRWISVVGARPQFVKLAPICRAIEQHNASQQAVHIDHTIVHTGQHYDPEVADLLFVQMRIPEPRHNLAVGSASHGAQVARMLERLEPVLQSQPVDWVIVYGDTNSTLAAAIVAVRLQLPLAHVEAGCRSNDLAMPEEQSRIVADHLSQLLLAPSPSALANLHREGIGSVNDPRGRRAALVGDVMYDALLQNSALADSRAGDTLRRFGLEPGAYYVLTLHRAENTNEPSRLRSILSAASSLDLPVLFPVHPRTKNVLVALGVSPNGRVRVAPPVGYLEMLALEKNARIILTDSGGVQKEAYYMGVPCVTLRDRTEWPETVEASANYIAGTDPESIRQAVNSKPAKADWPRDAYGDGFAARKIVDQLLTAASHG